MNKIPHEVKKSIGLEILFTPYLRVKTQQSDSKKIEKLGFENVTFNHMDSLKIEKNY